MAGSDLVVSVGANIRQLDRQMKAAAAVSEKAADDIERKFKSVNPSLSTDFGIGLLKGAIAGVAFDRIIRGLADANREMAQLGETANRVGVDLARFQELRFAAQAKGVTGKQFDSGIEGLAEKLNDARREENELSKLFDANNLKLKDRQGNVLSVNDALGQAADLIRNAATEFDKIKIAEMVGLTKEWVPLLEGGAEGLERAASAARAAGAVIDADVIQKAKEFDEKWTAAVNSWAIMFKANLGGIIDLINNVIGLAGRLGDTLSNYSAGLSAKADLEKNGIEGLSRESLDYAMKNGLTRQEMSKAVRDRLEVLEEFDREAARAKPLVVNVKKPTPTNPTAIPVKASGGGGGGGGGKSEEEQAQQRLERYIETLKRQNSVLDAEVATFGKSNAEKRAAVELAKAQVDLAKLDEESRQKVIASLTQEINLSEQKRAQLKSLQDAQKGLNDAQKFFGDAAVDALEDLIFNGAKAEDVVKKLAQSLAKAAIQAALMGTGPLAGIFGTTGQNGAAGGLFGMFGSMFGRATGGGVNARQAYRVGERGPETFVPTTAGRIVPNGRGGGLRVVINNTAAGQVQTSAERQPNGDLTVMVSAIEAQMAQNAVRGKGSFAPALGAIRDGRQLRG